MGKAKETSKETKKQPAKTPKEKKAAKQAKKHASDTAPDSYSLNRNRLKLGRIYFTSYSKLAATWPSITT